MSNVVNLSDYRPQEIDPADWPLWNFEYTDHEGRTGNIYIAAEDKAHAELRLQALKETLRLVGRLV